MDFEKLANALVPDTDLLPIEEYDKIYPPRALEKGAEVTRIAPSPTGFMHLGNLYVAPTNASRIRAAAFFTCVSKIPMKSAKWKAPWKSFTNL